jgi:RNA chaperone Hfq
LKAGQDKGVRSFFAEREPSCIGLSERINQSMRKRDRAWTSRRGVRDGIQESILRSRQVEDQTNAEVQYLANLIRNRTPVTVKLVNGDNMSGWIEYYDRNFIRLTRATEANVFIYKDQIEYIQEG